MSDYIYINEHFVLQENVPLLLNNRAFLYGDGFFETIHWHNGIPLFLDDHIQRIRFAFETLKLNSKALKFSSLFDRIKELTQKNNCYYAARVRVTFYRQAAGNYTPATNDFEIMITAQPLDTGGFVWNKEGITVGIYTENFKVSSPASAIKTLSSIVYVLAGIYAKANRFDDVLLVNEKKNIVEAQYSNLFIVQSGRLVYPPLSEGCVDGVMRKQVIKLAKQARIEVNEKCISAMDLKTAEEVFLTNVINGIRWVKAFEDKTYYSQLSVKIFTQLQQSLRETD